MNANPDAGQTGIVQRILVKGNERIEPATVISYLPISVGERVDPAKLDQAIKALFRTDLFSDVSMGFANGDLTITIVENPIINRVIFEGNSASRKTSCATKSPCAPAASSPAPRLRPTSAGSSNSTVAPDASRRR